MLRRLFLKAVLEEWDYLPGGRDEINQVAALDSQHAHELARFAPPMQPGSRFLKLRYHRFVDEAMTERWPDDPHLGLLGFLAHVVVGDTVQATVVNESPVAISLHPHGVRYNNSNEGMPAPGQLPSETSDDAILPGQRYMYEWTVPPRSGPGVGESVSSVAWLVHSHVSEQADVNAGLVGVLVVTKAGCADEHGRPADVDREFALFWNIQDEGRSRVARQWMRWDMERATSPSSSSSSSLQQQRRVLRGRGRSLHVNIAAPGYDPPLNASDGATAALLRALGDSTAVMRMRMHAVNGRVFGTLKGLQVRVGERVRWYSLALGDEQDLHTPHWHGATVVTSGGMTTDTLSLLPGVSVTADMVPDVEGTFLVHCHVQHHMVMGMAATYSVLPSDGNGSGEGRSGQSGEADGGGRIVWGGRGGSSANATVPLWMQLVGWGGLGCSLLFVVSQTRGDADLEPMQDEQAEVTGDASDGDGDEQ